MSIFSELVIIGYKNAEFHILDYVGQASIPDYLRNISLMCFNSEFDYAKESIIQKNVDDINSRNYLHQFVMTDNQGQRRYCTSLIVFEKGEEIFLPVAYCILSQESNLIKQKNFMTALYNGVFDRVTRYRDKGWELQKQRVYNQNLIEFYLSVGMSNIKGVYYMPKQGQRGNRQEIVNDVIIDNPARRSNLLNQDICFRLLFSKLSISNVIKIVKALMMEKQIVLFTQRIWDLANITEALLSLVYPLTWPCIYIPYLPPQMLDTIHISVPYIIGVHMSEKEKVISQFDCVDKILIDIDSDRVIGFIPSFPQEANLVSLSASFSQSDLFDNMKIMQLQAHFLKYILKLVGNFLPYFTFSMLGDQFKSIDEIFDKCAYIESFQTDQEFYRDLTRSMMFTKLIEDTYKQLYQTDFLKLKVEPLLYLQILKYNTTLDAHIQNINQQQEYVCFHFIKSDKSIHLLWPKYLEKIKNKEFKPRKFPILAIDKSKLTTIEQSQQPVVIYSEIIINDDTAPINHIGFMKVSRIPKYLPSFIKQDADQCKVIIRHPTKKPIKILKKQQQSMILFSERKQLELTQVQSVRQSKIFNNQYVSMFKTKSCAKLKY